MFVIVLAYHATLGMTQKCTFLHLFWSLFILVYRYSSFRLIDTSGLKEVMPLTMNTFLDHVKESSLRGREILLNDWITECSSIVQKNRDGIEQWMPSDEVRCAFLYMLFIVIQIHCTFIMLCCQNFVRFRCCILMNKM